MLSPVLLWSPVVDQTRFVKFHVKREEAHRLTDPLRKQLAQMKSKPKKSQQENQVWFYPRSMHVFKMQQNIKQTCL